MRYLIRVLDAHQQIHTLQFEAGDEADALRQVRARRLNALSVKATGPRSSGREAHFPLLLFAQELLALTDAGLSLIESLETLLEKERDAARAAVLARLAQDLREDHRLSAAMRQQPAHFPALFVGIVQAAEGTSGLSRALQRFIDHQQRMAALRHRVVSAGIYPAVLAVVGLAVVLFLLGYVVPRFAAVYQSSGRDLPWASRLLLQWGDLVSQHRLGLAVGLVLVVLAGVAWVRQRRARGGWLQMAAALPGAAATVGMIERSRLYLTLGMLLEGGIPLRDALGLCASLDSAVNTTALVRTQTRIAAGEPLSAALEAEGLATPVALRLMRAGEQSGQLGPALCRAAEFHDDETSRAIERFSKAFEPALMAGVGLVIGLIVILLYMPVFELAGSLP